VSTAKPTTDKVVTEILAGRHDGRLVDIAQAIERRVTSDATGWLWRITLPDGEAWDSETVTVGELTFVEQTTGVSYLLIDPNKSMAQFRALVTAHHVAAGLERDAAIAKASALTQSEAVKAVTHYEGTLGKGSGSTS